jgi:hypothetical protein
MVRAATPVGQLIFGSKSSSVKPIEQRRTLHDPARMQRFDELAQWGRAWRRR